MTRLFDPFTPEESARLDAKMLDRGFAAMVASLKSIADRIHGSDEFGEPKKPAAVKPVEPEVASDAGAVVILLGTFHPEVGQHATHHVVGRAAAVDANRDMKLRQEQLRSLRFHRSVA